MEVPELYKDYQWTIPYITVDYDVPPVLRPKRLGYCPGSTNSCFCTSVVQTIRWDCTKNWFSASYLFGGYKRQTYPKCWQGLPYIIEVSIETPGGQNPQCSSSILLPCFSINSMARGFCDIPGWYGECFVCQRKESLVSHNVWKTYSGWSPKFLEPLQKYMWLIQR